MKSNRQRSMRVLNSKYRRFLQPAVLSLSLLTVMAGAAVSPALGVIAVAFPQAERLTVQFVATLPALVMIPFLFVSSWLVGKFPKRIILLTGLLVYIAGGLGGVVAPGILSLLLSRVILGIGVGLVMPLSTALISDFFEDRERARLMGMSSSSNMLGGFVSLVLSGYLASFHWRYSFLIYLFALPVLVMAWLFIPEPPEHPSPDSHRTRLPFSIYCLAVGMFCLNLVFFALPPTMAFFLKESALGTSREAGTAVACSTLAGFFAGLFLHTTHRLSGKHFLSAMLSLMAIGFFTLHFSLALWMVFGGSFLIGFANRSLYPYVFLKASNSVPGDQTVKAMATLSAMIFLGQFTSPVFLDFMGRAFNDPAIRFSYLMIGIMLCAGVCIFFIKEFFYDSISRE